MPPVRLSAAALMSDDTRLTTSEESLLKLTYISRPKGRVAQSAVVPNAMAKWSNRPLCGRPLADRRILNDISVLSKCCYGRSLGLGKAPMWRMLV
jgi:hypothetical protein